MPPLPFTRPPEKDGSAPPLAASAIGSPSPTRASESTSFGGIALISLAMLVFATQDAITKSLTASLPVAEIVFVRFCAFLAFALALAARSEAGVGGTLRSAVPRRQLLRCLLIISEIALFAHGLRFLGIAEIHALFSCFPLVVAALSVPLLGEPVGPRRWMAVLVGLVGTLVILRPGSAVFEPAALIPLGCAVLYALYNLLTREVSRHDAFGTSLLWFGLVGSVASGAVALWHWQPIGRDDALLLAALCATSVLGHGALIKALQLTEAVVLQPFHYMVLPWSMLIGYLVYGERLGAVTLVGAAIVVGSGVYVAWRETRVARARTMSPESALGD